MAWYIECNGRNEGLDKRMSVLALYTHLHPPSSLYSAVWVGLRVACEGWREGGKEGEGWKG